MYMHANVYYLFIILLLFFFLLLHTHIYIYYVEWLHMHAQYVTCFDIDVITVTVGGDNL